jgi:hypothetical protein
MTIQIRTPEPDETPLSEAEQIVAIREGFNTGPRWHSGVVKNFSVMSARMNRAAAIISLNKAKEES